METDYQTLLNDRYFSIGLSMHSYKTNLVPPQEEVDSPSYKLAVTYDKVMNEQKYSPAIKAITRELYIDIAAMTHDTFVVHKYINDKVLNGVTDSSIEARNPETGEKVAVINPNKPAIDESLFNHMIHPKSVVTNLDSKLICTTGKNDADGNACQ